MGVHWTFLSYSNSSSKIVLILHSLLLPSLSFPNIIRFHYFSSHLLSYPYILHYLPQISFYLLNAALRSTKIINILRFSPIYFLTTKFKPYIALIVPSVLNPNCSFCNFPSLASFHLGYSHIFCKLCHFVNLAHFFILFFWNFSFLPYFIYFLPKYSPYFF